jgi:1-deoxy-D-xylulose-5-phosphate synthase
MSQKFYKWGILNDDRRKRIIRLNNSLKCAQPISRTCSRVSSIRYFGPIDGHDVDRPCAHMCYGRSRT